MVDHIQFPKPENSSGENQVRRPFSWESLVTQPLLFPQALISNTSPRKPSLPWLHLQPNAHCALITRKGSDVPSTPEPFLGYQKRMNQKEGVSKHLPLTHHSGTNIKSVSNPP